MSWTPYYRTRDAICEYEEMCNGQMCADICKLGSVKVDEWSTEVLSFQRWLQLDINLVQYQWPGSHNSAMSVAYGFGIEFDFISELLNGEDPYWGGGDLHLGEGVDQYLSITDQLNMGIRHIEVDINWAPDVSRNYPPEIIVCHSITTNFAMLAVINKSAIERGISLDWDPSHLRCNSMHMSFTVIMNEIKTWLNKNPKEFVIIYFDNKWSITPAQASWGTNALISVFGDWIFTPAEKHSNNGWLTMRELLSKGKRVLIETQAQAWSVPSNASDVVFYPAIWNQWQFGADDFQNYPLCKIFNIYSYPNITRLLNDYVSDAVTGNQRQYFNSMTVCNRCSINILSPHMINPSEMYRYIWTFGNQKPNIYSNETCVAMEYSGKWTNMDCNVTLHIACQNMNNPLEWMVSEVQSETYSWTYANANPKDVCKDGYVFSVPTDGYINANLQVQALTNHVWLNVNLNDFYEHQKKLEI